MTEEAIAYNVNWLKDTDDEKGNHRSQKGPSWEEFGVSQSTTEAASDNKSKDSSKWSYMSKKSKMLRQASYLLQVALKYINYC